MELRHLRYFIAVAEEGSLNLAAEKRLHTSQPSLSRQIRDLELEVGAQLFHSPRPAGRFSITRGCHLRRRKLRSHPPGESHILQSRSLPSAS
jgi:DNA-binding transcriptional LysR family regulator